MWPLTPILTFLANSVPVIGAFFLNELQRSINDLTVRTLSQRIRCQLRSYDGNTIDVTYVRGAWVKDYASTKWVAVEVAEPGVTLDVTSLVPAAGSFAAGTWYYLYLRANNLVPEWVISTTAPGTGQLWRGTDQSYRFIGSFRTSSLSKILPYQSRDGRVLYTGGNPADYETLPADVTTTSFVAYDLIFAPPHTRRASLRCDVLNASDTTDETLRILPHGLAGVVIAPANVGRAVFCHRSPVSGKTHRIQQLLELEVGPLARVSAKLDTAAMGSSAAFTVEGYEDW